ncbi:hypothetical protein ABIF97_000433 [Bradyrhizobium japonicum]|jgi:hypothetical protein|uniref:TniB family NTP-binding protein n=1 Tax=Bradyrhizobium barranii subsp. barranii TaxID=2823807 RepID=A0A939MDA1_9BRAD|nr:MULTISPECIES: TniB family NTP-binding protein [Bradyrhizobium]UEM10678.1 TniB family NTP-binding protein [Bradyrhizobium barranii subsp. barranii]
MERTTGIDLEALKRHRSKGDAAIRRSAALHRAIKGLIVLNDRCDAIMNELEFLLASSGGTAESTCLPLIAPTRAGKTTAIKLFLALHPPHLDEKGRFKEVPVLYVPTPARASVNDIAAAVLWALGDPDPTQGTEKQRLRRIHHYIEKLNVRMIIFDELHHLVSRKNDEVNHDSAEWIKQLINDVSCGFVVAGTERLARIFLVNDQLTGRIGDYEFRVDPYNVYDPEDFKEYRGYLASFDHEIVATGAFSKIGGLAVVEFASRILLASQGWPGFTAKLIHAAARIGLEEGASKMEIKHFARAFDSLMLFMKRAGKNPFRGGLLAAKEVWLDDETFAALLERLEEERRRKFKRYDRASWK